MKRFLLLIAILSAITPLSAANDITQLSADAQIEYLTNALSVEIVDQMNTYGSSLGTITNFGLITTSSVSSTTIETEWYPYLGSTEISRLDFFKLTGQNDIVAEYEAAEGKASKMKIFGAKGLMKENNLPGVLMLTSGLCLSGVGLGSIALISWEYKDDVSVSFAIGLADIYNNKLYESLK